MTQPTPRAAARLALLALTLLWARPIIADAPETTTPAGPPHPATSLTKTGAGTLILPGATSTTRPTTSPTSRPGAAQSPVAEKIAVTEHEIRTAEGHPLRYRASAGFLPLKDENGKLRANFFHIAYEKLNQPAAPADRRPITFVFNGGPGAAAIWLHLGTAGPKRIDLDDEGYPGPPPYRLVDNTSTWLAASDLVFIDPVGTGYSRPAEGVKGEEFFGVQQDIDSVGEFIRLYLTKSKRWASPKYLAGESYGTTRGALLAEHLHDRYGMAINGVILISTVLDFQTLSPGGANELPYPLFLPTYTAAAHYHKKLDPELQKDLKQTIAEVKKWVVETYAPALMKGSDLAGEERAAVTRSMARYTGLSETYLTRADLRVDPSEFQKELLADRRQVAGRFDARIVGDSVDPAASYAEYDPSLSRYVGVYSGTFNRYAREDLGFETELNYEFLSNRVHPWNWGRDGRSTLSAAGNLKRAMTKNPHLRVLVASGYHDLATPFFAADYTVNHLGVSPKIRKNLRQTYYPGGHMMYHHRPALEQLNRDVNAFLAPPDVTATN